MDSATSDYANGYSDTFLSPDDEEGGIYTLEEAGSPMQTPIQSRYANDLRMRRNGMRHQNKNREGFSSQDYIRGSNIEYPGSSTTLRSSREYRPPIDNIMWDERPRSFRPNSSNLYAELFIPPSLRPWGDGPSPYLAYPQYSQSRTASLVDRFESGENSTPVTPIQKIQPSSNNISSENIGQIIAKNFELGVNMIKIILFIVIIVLLAMWILMGAFHAKRDNDNIKMAIREAIAATKT